MYGCRSKNGSEIEKVQYTHSIQCTYIYMYIRPFCSSQYALYVRITCNLLVCISAVSTLACIKGTRRQEHTSIIQCILRSMYLITFVIYMYVHSVVSNTHTLCTTYYVCFTRTFQQSLLLASKDKNTQAYICMHITLPTVHNYELVLI